MLYTNLIAVQVLWQRFGKAAVMAAKRKVLDRGVLALDYRAGVHSLREMAATYGISAPRIQQIANEEGWERDLGARIRESAAEKLRAANASPTAEEEVLECQIVEVGSDNVVRTVLAHRKDALRARTMAMSLMAELETLTVAPAMLRDLHECLTNCSAGQEIPPALLYRAEFALGQAMTLANRATILKTVVDSLSKVVAIEREAFGIGDPSPSPAEPPTGTFSDFAVFRAKFMAVMQRHSSPQ